jgi:hypothetical protein
VPVPTVIQDVHNFLHAKNAGYLYKTV